MSDGYYTGTNTINGNTIIIGTGGGGGGGGCSTGGQITFVPGTQWITVNIPNNYVPVPTIGGIDLAVPVEKKKKDSAGCTCKKCKELFEYAEPNQEDGTLICWACRHGY